MKVVLDQRTCNCWQPACEAHFGWHFLREEVTPVDCTVEMSDDGKKELTFVIKDRDGSDKLLVVNEANRGAASDSWRQAWEEQQAGGAAPSVVKPAVQPAAKPVVKAQAKSQAKTASKKAVKAGGKKSAKKR